MCAPGHEGRDQVRRGRPVRIREADLSSPVEHAVRDPTQHLDVAVLVGHVRQQQQVDVGGDHVALPVEDAVGVFEDAELPRVERREAQRFRLAVAERDARTAQTRTEAGEAETAAQVQRVAPLQPGPAEEAAEQRDRSRPDLRPVGPGAVIFLPDVRSDDLPGAARSRETDRAQPPPRESRLGQSAWDRHGAPSDGFVARVATLRAAEFLRRIPSPTPTSCTGSTSARTSLMKQGSQRLLAFAALAVPLAVMAVVGSSELGHQTERAERALAAQAADYVREVEREVEDAMSRADRLLDAIPALDDVRAAAASRSLRAREPAVLGLMVLDSDGGLLFPRSAPREIETLPFQRPSALSSIRRAEVLELLGDEEGAREALLEVVGRLNDDGTRFVSRENVALRAHFMLAGLLRKTGDLDGAEEQYLIALVEAFGPTTRPSDRDASRSTVGLWSELGLAELDVIRGRGASRALDLAAEIADGGHDSVSEPMLQAVLDAVDEIVADEPGARAVLARTREDDALRRTGRTFADEYGAFLRESVRRRLERAPRDGSAIRWVHAGPGGAQLLAIRPARETERQGSIDEFDGAAWIGVRFDLDQLLAEALAERLAAGSGPFALGVSDSEGAPIVPPLAVELSASEARAEVTTSTGLRLFAAPLDPTALVAERRRSLRNRTLLFILLCATAGGGALLLLRSVARESEVAALKIALVSRVTHDLKTPLALIRMYAETIGRGRARTPEEASRFAGIVLREADVLTRMVERVLDFSRKEAGTLTYNARACDVRDNLEMLGEAFRPHAEARNIRFSVDLPDEGLETRVDPGAFESAVLDLLENATKYTSPDATAPTIELRARSEDERLVLEVADRGIGIPESERERVFESFIRGSNAGEARGSGLGLSLVRHFARAHGGDAEAEPREGGGTVLRLTLPRVSLSAVEDVPDEPHAARVPAMRTLR
ncbi:MAG: hypothetical protein RL562_3220 [Planctomycetota bacterium]